MCLPGFIGTRIIPVENPIIGYRSWISPINSNKLFSPIQSLFEWDKVIEGPHIITEEDSGIYAYNYNYYYNHYYNYNYNNNNDYYILGIIHQYGTVAFHKTGQRSEFAKIKTLFTNCESNAVGTREFIEWISKFNNQVKSIAERFEADTVHWLDFNESKSNINS